MDIDQHIAKARKSMFFTAPNLGSDLDRFLKVHEASIKQLARRAVDSRVEHIYWVGSGNSWTNLYLGKYLLDRFSGIPSDCFTSYEFMTRKPSRLNDKAWVFLASFSGATEDTVQALRYSNQRGAYTVALVNDANSLMGREAKHVIAYESNALYILPMAAAVLFSIGFAQLQGAEGMNEISQSLQLLPKLLTAQYTDEEKKARQRAAMFSNENFFYVLGTGPLYGLAYKFSMTVLMENVRVNSSCVDTPEVRHGPIEVLDRHKPPMLVLKGTDDTRPMVERVCRSLEEAGAKLILFDSGAYSDVHPLLTPFSLMIPLQWFVVYSAILRGITDLDERVFMGKGTLSSGEGILWP